MIIGFTGTREGMTWEQNATFHVEMQLSGVIEFHHGDCRGADAEAHYFAWRYADRVVVHPPKDPKLRAFVHRSAYWEDDFVVLPEKPYLERNRDIVDACDLLIACPKEERFDIKACIPSVDRAPRAWPRGGTWATVRYAMRVGKPVTIIWPDGSTT